jgi:hypothetical protein
VVLVSPPRCQHHHDCHHHHHHQHHYHYQEMLVINTITFWIRILIFLPLIIFTIVDYPAEA